MTLGGVPADPTEALAWPAVAMALVPSPTPVLCPICLDLPTLPRVTRCGHVYCLLCLLRFAALGRDPKSPDPGAQGGKGSQWRQCPICFEDFRVGEVRPARVLGQTDWRETGGWLPFVLRRIPGGPRAVVDRWEGLSPFDRVTRVTPGFLQRELVEREEVEMAVLISEATPFDADLLHAHLMSSPEADTMDMQPGDESSPTSPLSPLSPSSPSSVYFHQAADGQFLFLHPLSIKMLKAHYGSYAAFPASLTLRLLEIDWLVMGETERRRYKHLAHLPLGTPFGLCEVDLADLLPPPVLAQHRLELEQRARSRVARDRMDDERRDTFYREESTRMREEAMETAPILSSSLHEQPLRDYSQDYVNFPAIACEQVDGEPLGTEPIPIRGSEGSFAAAAGTPPLLAAAAGSSSGSGGRRGRGKTIALFGTSQRSTR